jgi:hypothetical protein
VVLILECVQICICFAWYWIHVKQLKASLGLACSLSHLVCDPTWPCNAIYEHFWLPCWPCSSRYDYLWMVCWLCSSRYKHPWMPSWRCRRTSTWAVSRGLTAVTVFIEPDGKLLTVGSGIDFNGSREHRKLEMTHARWTQGEWQTLVSLTSLADCVCSDL